MASQAEVSAPRIMHPEDTQGQVSNETPNSLSSLTAVQQPTKIEMQMGSPEGTTEVDKTKNNKQKQHALNYIAVQFKRIKDEAAAVG